MLQIFPFFNWIAAIASAVLLALSWHDGEMSRRRLFALTGIFALAVYWQFLAGSSSLGAAGLGLQTTLAVTLLIRVRLP